MPRKNEYTFVVERPMTRDAAKRAAQVLAELSLKRCGYTADITVRELQPGEEQYPIRCPERLRPA